MSTRALRLTLGLSLGTLIVILFTLATQLSHAQAGSTAISGKFYRFDIVAAAGQGSLTNVSQSPSLNDSGVVAFTGVTAAGNGIYLSDVSGATPRNITSAFTATNRFFTSSPQINNSNQVVAHERFVDAQVRHLLRRWDGSLMNPQPSIIIAGANFVGFNDFNSIYPFAGINNNNQAAFNVQGATTEELVTGLRPNFNRLPLPNAAAALRPMVADDGRVVVRAGGLTTHPILLYQYNLTSSVSIASSPDFTTLGQSPGISDDGQAVVFYGVEATGGPGIFISLDLGGATRQRFRIAGNRQIEDLLPPTGNLDGVCDPGEPCLGGELGFDGAAPLIFTSFDPNSRVAVAHQSVLPAGLANDTFVISFIGTPSAASTAPQHFSNQKGLWTIRVDIKDESGTLRVKPQTAIPVVQINDTIGTRTITDFMVYDQVANAMTDDAGVARTQRKGDHKIAFWASTNLGNIIVRGSHLDSDEDELFDHWETMGIDFNGNGGAPDLALHQAPFNANPNRKDVFVEIDYLEASGHTHRPDRTPSNTPLVNATVLQAVTNAFTAAPVPNPTPPGGSTPPGDQSTCDA